MISVSGEAVGLGLPDGARPTRALVDLEAIASNFRLLGELAGGRPVYAVLKADAYGHGALPVARRLAREGADRFAVAMAEEGVALRRGGIAGEILVLFTGDASEIPLHRSYGLVPALHGLEQAREFAEVSAGYPEPLAVHLELDTGMTRLGVAPDEISAVAGVLRGAGGLRVSGLFTQLARAEDPAASPTRAQVEILRAGMAALRSAGVDFGVVHAANSGALLRHPDTLFDAVRPGIALYGVLPAESLPDPGLRPAMTVDTRVLSVRDVPRGAALGYGGTFVTSRPSRIAALPIGYDDGLRRSFSGRASVLLRGKRVPIVGMVNMDLTLIDATDAGAERGDRAVLLGRSGSEEIGAWELARAADTIPYEILCGVGARVPRVYSGDGPAA